jgi:hypothetical protein
VVFVACRVAVSVMWTTVTTLSLVPLATHWDIHPSFTHIYITQQLHQFTATNIALKYHTIRHENPFVIRVVFVTCHVAPSVMWIASTNLSFSTSCYISGQQSTFTRNYATLAINNVILFWGNTFTKLWLPTLQWTYNIVWHQNPFVTRVVFVACHVAPSVMWTTTANLSLVPPAIYWDNH